MSEIGAGWRSTLWRASLVFCGCVVGALISAHLGFPKIGTAILFPPYAVLTAALLVEQPRRYPIILLASAAGNLVPHLQTGPLSFVLLTELANFSRALVVAYAVRRFGRQPANVNGLRTLAVFLSAGVVVGPALGALIGSVVAVAYREASFALVFRAWFFSNALTGITLLLPLFLVNKRSLFKLPSARRVLEAAVLSGGLMLVGVLVFLGWSTDGRALSASVYWPMPFLLWAAVRFGLTGISTALLWVAALTIGGAIEGHGPFATGSPTENLLDVQLFLLVVAVPLLLLSALIEQHRVTASELRASRAQFQSVVEDQTEMICRFMPDGTYSFANGAFRRQFDFGQHTLENASAFSLVPQDSLSGISPASSASVREVEVMSPGGERAWQQWHDRGLFDERGSLVEYQSVGRDITANKLRERHERDLLAQREVERALRETDRQKDEFLAMLGHELRNPLAPIGSALELLQSAVLGEPVERAREVISRQLVHLKRLVDDLLDVSRITRGTIRVELFGLDARDVTLHAIETVRPLIDARGHELTVSLPPACVPIRADHDRLAQVLINVLNNAAKYTAPGGRISFSLRVESGAVSFEVKDNGAGVPTDQLERIFGLFERGAADSVQSLEGLGIGLTLSRRLVELHAGTILARSAGRGCGSVFVVQLPLAPLEELAQARSPKAHQLSSTLPLKILVVDDNVDAADTLAEQLTTWGHEVSAVYAGTAALSAVRELHPDVVLSDIGLPDLGGLDLARELRRELHAEARLLVAITGFGQARDREKSIQAGFDHHLVKPIDFKELARLLASAGRRSSMANRSAT